MAGRERFRRRPFNASSPFCLGCKMALRAGKLHHGPRRPRRLQNVYRHWPRFAFWTCYQYGVGGEGFGAFHPIHLATCSRGFASIGNSSPMSAHPMWHRRTVAMAAADAGGGPCDDSAQQQSCGDGESEDHRTPARFRYRGLRACNHAIDTFFRIRPGKTGGRRNELSKVSSILTAHPRVARRRQENPSGFCPFLPKVHVRWATRWPEQAVDFIA